MIDVALATEGVLRSYRTNAHSKYQGSRMKFLV